MGKEITFFWVQEVLNCANPRKRNYAGAAFFCRAIGAYIDRRADRMACFDDYLLDMKSLAVCLVFSISVGLGAGAAAAAAAACGSSAPKNGWNLHSDDQRVTADFLAKTLEGKEVKYDGGTETYRTDGSYAYKAGSETWKAPGYRFYKDGVRCIDYSKPRYDLYVVNNGKLVLVNWGGGRYEGRLTK
ncbi:hypothetical protein [Falsiphaeobacter marinintestinus]|uniref:hypothetical protein n=1 Tax=Falsiphaeobacter marinintestinus TaxID=1492905 RepID=UPI0011B46F36|nr:hypothetical protein [Phaeobacter marinintestinus]